jgi:TP901 family phage tail tape measure protein
MAGKIVDVTLRLIDKVTSPLGGVNSKLKDSAQQWTRAGKQIEKTGKAITSVGSSMTRNVTVPIVGAGVASVKLASDFEAGMSKVQSISGATQKEIGALGEKAKEMGAKTKFSATEATEAYQYMAMAGWKAGDMANGIEGIMYLAGATGEDLASTSDIVTDALTAFGKTAKDTGNFVDVMAKTASSANTDVSMLGESFKYVAPVAGAMKYSIEDTSLALGLMANAGVKASSAGTSLRSWITRMASRTK